MAIFVAFLLDYAIVSGIVVWGVLHPEMMAGCLRYLAGCQAL